MWGIHTDAYRFDFVLAIFALFLWVKIFLYFKITKTFGPIFKILHKIL